MKTTLLAGTLALVTGCNSLYDLVTYGSSNESRPNPEIFAAWPQDHQARETGEDIAKDVIFAAQVSVARHLTRGSTYPESVLPCVAQILGNDPLAAYCFSVAKEGAAVAHGVRRTAFPDEYYQAIAQQAEDAATTVRESFLRFMLDTFGDNRTRIRRNRYPSGIGHAGLFYLRFILFGGERP